MKKKISILLVLVMAFVAAVPVFADEQDVLQTTAKYIYENTPDPVISSIGGEWSIIGLARSGYNVDGEYYDKYYENVKKFLRENEGVLHDRKYTEYSRAVIALSAMGKDPTDVEGYNLLEPLGDYEKTIWQGINGPIWALIALDCADYEMPENSQANIQATRDMYIEKILLSQNDDGGWSLAEGSISEADITAMALTALSEYIDREEVSNAINKGLSYLSETQKDDGGYSGMESNNAESCAQVIIALCELGISVEDEGFIKNGNTLEDNLMSFYLGNGEFRHMTEGDDSNRMATEQALCALAAIERNDNNKTSFYDMSDVEKNISEDAKDDAPGLSLKNDAVKVQPVVNPGKTFTDIQTNSEKDKIEALAERGIINGKDENYFEPDSSMTRAEFTTIVVKSLGLDTVSNKIFDDVSENDWYFDFVSTAYEYKIVNGISEKEFNPGGTITREEAAVMVQRAANLCGIIKEYDDFAIRNILAAFVDYVEISDWAREAYAFCFDNNILSDEDIEILPKIPVKRYEIAAMIYNMLYSAELIQ